MILFGGFYGSHIFKAQLPCLHHSIPSPSWGLRGCGGILSGVSVSCAEMLWLLLKLPSLCCVLQGCVCITSVVFHVMSTAFQNAPYTTQLVLCFAGLCVHCKQGILCYSQSLPKSNIHFLAHVAFCRTVRALQADSCMLRAQPSRVQYI